MRRVTQVLLLFILASCLCAGAELSSSKISAHFIGNYTAGSSNIVHGRPVVLKLLGLDSGWPSGMISAMRDYKAKAPAGKLVVRIYSPKQYSLADNASWAAGDFWTNILKKSLDYLTPADRALIDYLEGPNEGQTPTLGYPSESALEASRWFNQFWTNLTPRIVAGGYKPCIGSIAVGNPGGDVNAHLTAFVPALRQAKAAGGNWSYHAYTIQYTTDPGLEYWYSLRYRQFYEFFAASFPDLSGMPLILTEGGVDDHGDPNTSGWRARGSASDYQRWLNWFDQQLARDPYVLGCTLFQNGDPSGWWSFELEPIAAWLRDYLLPPPGLPPAPSGLSASNTADGIAVTWTNVPLSPCYYVVKRATNSAGPFWTLATNLTEGVKAATFLDGGAIPEIDYFYKVTCVNAVGEGPASAVLPARMTLPFPSAVNCGGGDVQGFMADLYFNGGTGFTTLTVVTTNGVVDAAPAQVYQSQRYGNHAYRLRTKSPQTPYKLRLHFAELWWPSAGQRVFDVLVNGAPVLESFDIVAAAGGAFKGVVREVNTASDTDGNVHVQFVTRVDNASINGLELIAVPENVVPAAPSNLSAQAGSGVVTLTWVHPVGAVACSVKRATSPSGPYTVIATNLPGATYQDPSFAPGTTYYYVVTAVNGAGESQPSAPVSIQPTSGLPDVVVTSVGWTPTVISNGAAVQFWARVLNRGSAPTPAITLGVGFNMDGKGTVSWSSAHSTPLQPNASVVLTADGGPSPSGRFWTATRGRHQLVATVDDINRFSEGIESNNACTTNLYVFSPRPVLTSCVLSNGTAHLSWNSLAGASYVLQSAPGLNVESWVSADPVVAYGTNSSSTWRNVPDTRFFRVLQWD